jgi:hypothetical protein
MSSSQNLAKLLYVALTTFVCCELKSVQKLYINPDDLTTVGRLKKPANFQAGPVGLAAHG